MENLESRIYGFPVILNEGQQETDRRFYFSFGTAYVVS